MNVRGVTFIEVIIAALLMSLVVAGMFSGFSSFSNSIAENEREREAMSFSRQLLDALRMRASDDTVLDDTSGLFVTAAGPLPVIPAGAFRDQFAGTTEYLIDDIDASNPADSNRDFKRITVQAEWEPAN